MLAKKLSKRIAPEFEEKNSDKEDNDEENLSKESEESEEEEEEKVEELINTRKSLMANRGQRVSVSAEAYGIFNKKAEFVPRVVAKTIEQRERIYKKVIQSFLFNSLEEKDLNTVIDAMEEKTFLAGDYVIRQGENGSVLYLVEKGELDCSKRFVRIIMLIFID